MLRLLGHTSAACDGLSRRDLLRAGSLAALGLAPMASAAPVPAAHRGTFGKAKAIILIDLFGGPSHIDMLDPKPDTPLEIRGEFKAIPTKFPGVQVCEHLPRTAEILDSTCLIRTVSHTYNSHNPYAVMTGFTGGQDAGDYYSKPTNHPSIPSVCQYFGIGKGKELPGYMMLPAFPGYSQGLRRAGPYGGYLGPKYEPVFSVCEPPKKGKKEGFYDHSYRPDGEPTLPKFDGNLTVDALAGRRKLVDQLDDAARRFEQNPVAGRMADKRREAFDLLTSPKAKSAFELAKEPANLRDRYGRDLFGQSTLLARRLVEAGVTFVTVHTESLGNGHWDTHSNNFNLLKHVLLPFFDQAIPTLIEDLRDRGLLDSTLVIVTGDMGRSPRINKNAGRDHWTQCGFCLLAGGGTKRGLVYGTSDKRGAYPVDLPVSPGDLAATAYHLVGVNPEETVPDHTGRPTHISHGGSVIKGILN